MESFWLSTQMYDTLLNYFDGRFSHNVTLHECRPKGLWWATIVAKTYDTAGSVVGHIEVRGFNADRTTARWEAVEKLNLAWANLEASTKKVLELIAKEPEIDLSNWLGVHMNPCPVSEFYEGHLEDFATLREGTTRDGFRKAFITTREAVYLSDSAEVSSLSVPGYGSSRVSARKDCENNVLSQLETLKVAIYPVLNGV